MKTPEIGTIVVSEDYPENYIITEYCCKPTNYTICNTILSLTVVLS